MDEQKIPIEYLESFEYTKKYIFLTLKGTEQNEPFFKNMTRCFRKNQKVELKIFNYSFKDLKIISLYSQIRTGDVADSMCHIGFEQ